MCWLEVKSSVEWLLDVVRNQSKCSGNLSFSFQIIHSKPQVFLQKKKNDLIKLLFYYFLTVLVTF